MPPDTVSPVKPDFTHCTVTGVQDSGVLPPKGGQLGLGPPIVTVDRCPGPFSSPTKEITHSLHKSVFHSLVLSLLLSLSVSMIAMGLTFRDSCPRNNFISAFLIVTGSVLTVKFIGWVVYSLRKRNNSDGEKKEGIVQIRYMDGLINVFLAVWYTIGSVSTIMMYGDFQTSYLSVPDYCSQVLYEFTVVAIVLSGVIALLIGAAVIVSAAFPSRTPNMVPSSRRDSSTDVTSVCTTEDGQTIV